MIGADATRRRRAWETAVDWPHRERSRFLDAGGLCWHLQRFGDAGPEILLLHGTGASAHSFRDLAPLLADRHRVLVPDLPGHGFSSVPQSGPLSLPRVAAALAELLALLGVRPSLLVGHSAGAAVAARVLLDDAALAGTLTGLSPALLPLHGLAGVLFSPAARLAAGSDWLAGLVARRASRPEAVVRMIRATGSRLDATGEACYGALLRRPEHIAGTLQMMAGWDLTALARDLPALQARTTLVLAGADRTLPRGYDRRLQARMPAARVVRLEGLGHLAHEEAPGRIAELLAADGAEEAL